MRNNISIRYKSSASAMIYRDGGSLELCFTADDNQSYSVYMQVILRSPEDCRRYAIPVLLKDTWFKNDKFDVSDDYIQHLTWQEIVVLLNDIKAGMKDEIVTYPFAMIEKLANNDGWYLESH